MNPVDDKNVAAQIAKLYELHQSGALSDTEYENAKRRVLDGQPSQRTPQPPTREYTHEEEPRPKSRLFHLVRGFAIGIASFVALFIVLVVAVAVFGDNDHDSDSRSSNRSSVSATVVPTSVSRTDTFPGVQDDGPTMTVSLLILPGAGPENTVTNTVSPGAECHGIGQYEPLRGGAVASVTNVRGAQDHEGAVSPGTVNEHGQCEMEFTVPAFEADNYMFGIDNDVFVECSRGDVHTTSSGLAVEIRYAPGGRYCQP